MKKIIFLIICFFSISAVTSAQNYSESGSQIITNYSPKDYKALQSNWAIAQAKNGIMYFGNDFGLLEFDGASWNLYQVPNKSTIRSLAYSEDGKLYAGAVGELGYFSADSLGKLKFHSLMKYLPNERRNFSDVWQTFVVNEKVYYNTSNYLLIWNIQKKEFSIIKAAGDFHIVFEINGTIYAREWGKGLEILNSDSLVVVKGSEQFANERIYVMLPFPGKEGIMLIVTRNMGMFKYDGNNFIPFKTEADQFIKDNLIYMPGTVLSDGNILLGTINGGAIVIDGNGKLIRRYNSKSGIINVGVLYTLQDSSGAIWLGTTNGISRIDYSSPVNYFDSRNNFSTSANDIIRHKGTIYSAANNGVYYLDPNTSDFHLLKNSNNQSWNFIEIGNDLVVGTFDGLFTVDKEKLSPIKKTIGNEFNVNLIKQSTTNPNRYYIGAQGLWTMLKGNNGLAGADQILKITDVVSSIVEDNDGRLWCGTGASSVFRITFRKDNKGNIILANPLVEHFDKTNGLQSGLVYITKINGENYFATNDSLYKFDESRKRFVSDTSDNIISALYKLSGNKGFNFIQQDGLGRLWLGSQNTLAMGARQYDGSYKWLTSPFKRIVGEQINKVYSENKDVVWFTSGAGIIKYDFSKKNLINTKYSALVRRVEIGRDSTIFFGEMLPDYAAPAVSYKDNSVKFNFSAASYEGKNTNRFKTFLEGFDDVWSSWSNESTKEYTNLPPGKYTFKIISENILGIKSSTGTYSFKILPPWYRTWWAYGGYIIFLGLFVFGIDRTQRRRLTLKERKRSHLREMELRTEAAELEAKALQAENDRKKNVELLSEIGKEITATLDLDTIFYKLYEHVNQLADATVFGVGIYHPDKEEIEYRLAIEKGKRYPVYSRDTKDKNQFPVWCIENRKPVFINDVRTDYKKYIQFYKEPERVLEDGTKSEEAWSIIYLPLVSPGSCAGGYNYTEFPKKCLYRLPSKYFAEPCIIHFHSPG